MEEDIARLALALERVAATFATVMQKQDNYQYCWFCGNSTVPDPYSYDVYEAHAEDCPIAVSESISEKYGKTDNT